MKSMQISLTIHMAGAIFPAPYNGTREGRSNKADKITLEEDGKNRGSILLRSSFRALLKIENFSCILQMS